jgi:hypothetical protein
MTSEDLKELASVFRAESANVGGPVQASLQRIATMLDEKAAACVSPQNAKVFIQSYVPPIGYVDSDGMSQEYNITRIPDADVKLPTEPDDLESVD